MASSFRDLENLLGLRTETPATESIITRLTMRKRSALLLVFALCSVFQIAQARTITVTSPVTGDFLGKINKVNFNITGAEFQVKVRVVAENTTTGQKFTAEKNFTPTTQGTITDSVDLNFDASAPQGDYKLTVTPLEKNNAGQNQSYTPSSVTVNPVTVDVKSPTFYSVNPLDRSYVKGTGTNQIVKITAKLNEPNIDKWKVQVNAGDIPNNEGNGTDVSVDWSTKGVTFDGTQTIVIKVDDKAKNSGSKTVQVVLDRIKPSSSIVTPGPNTYLPPNTNIPVLVDVRDQFSDSMDITGLDVVAKTLDNKFITRVSRRATNNSGNTLSFSGRIRWTSKLPQQFKIVVTAIDRAGNRATVQETRVKIGNR